MKVVPLDQAGSLFLSPAIDDWDLVAEHGISVIIDLDGGLDQGVCTRPNEMLYIYFPIFDEDLPDLGKLHAVADLGASLIRAGHRVLSHCGMGFNRSALVAGLILTRLGMEGKDVVPHLRQCRPGALFNEVFACYLEGIGCGGEGDQ
jgi:protein-tyrosine phosphatase